MRGRYMIRMAALALAAAAALPAPSFAGDSTNPQQEARTEEWIRQVITGNVEADRQEQARVDRLVQETLQRVAEPAIQQQQQAARPAEMAEAAAGRKPLARTGIHGH